MQTKIVKLELRKGKDGHWLSFKNNSGQEASINIENKFPKRNGIINNCIRQWAEEQFENE